MEIGWCHTVREGAQRAKQCFAWHNSTHILCITGGDHPAFPVWNTLCGIRAGIARLAIVCQPLTFQEACGGVSWQIW